MTVLNEAFEKFKKTAPCQDKQSLFQIMQIDELKNNTEALNKANEVVETIAEYTLQNQKTANKQFWASIIIAISALIVSIIALFVK